jgi:hypothetical protein
MSDGGGESPEDHDKAKALPPIAAVSSRRREPDDTHDATLGSSGLRPCASAPEHTAVTQRRDHCLDDHPFGTRGSFDMRMLAISPTMP